MWQKLYMDSLPLSHQEKKGKQYLVIFTFLKKKIKNQFCSSYNLGTWTA